MQIIINEAARQPVPEANQVANPVKASPPPLPVATPVILEDEGYGLSAMIAAIIVTLIFGLGIGFITCYLLVENDLIVPSAAFKDLEWWKFPKDGEEKDKAAPAPAAEKTLAEKEIADRPEPRKEVTERAGKAPAAAALPQQTREIQEQIKVKQETVTPAP